jgi:hypothetical protein
MVVTFVNNGLGLLFLRTLPCYHMKVWCNTLCTKHRDTQVPSLEDYWHTLTDYNQKK